MNNRSFRILMVENGAAITRLFGAALQGAGYELIFAETAMEALRLTSIAAPVIIVLDLGLIRATGVSFLERLRAVTPAPVLVVAEEAPLEEKIAALDAGADDVIEDPIVVLEFLARVRAAVRRITRGDTIRPPAASVIGDLEIDFERRIAKVAGKRLALTPREWDLLAVLAERSGRVVTQRELLISLWGANHIADRQYLRVLIGRLRGKLGRAGDQLQTIPGVGYQLGVE